MRKKQNGINLQLALAKDESFAKFSTEKKIAALLSVISNTCLIVLKIICGVISGSVSVISEALHSLCDLLASLIAFISVQKSSEPPDRNHPFGHGKFEDLAGFIEAILIVLTALYILYLAVEKIITHHASHIDTSFGIWVMMISIFVNFFVSNYLFKVAKKTDSIALYTDAQHLSADIYSSLAVLLGLFAVKITGFYLIDPILAIIVGLLILKTGAKLVKESMRNLVDSALPEQEIEKISCIINNSCNNGTLSDLKIISLKTSKSGSDKNIQLEIGLNSNLTLKEAHDICNNLEAEISSVILNTKIIIHTEPI